MSICQLILLVCLNTGCKGHSPEQTVRVDSGSQNSQSVSSKPKSATSVNTNDEQQFRVFLEKFKVTVKKGDKAALRSMLYFPLQTLPQWTSEDLKAGSVNPADGLITNAEYSQYADNIFSKDALRLIPKCREDDLSEIDNTTTENYYITLKKLTDKGSSLYELQQQYLQKNGKETSYGFVFGKINGRFKIISYFCPWPLKG